jgi:acyl carrier protein
MDAIEDRIRRFVVEDLHGPPQQLTVDYPLIERGVLDSLGIMHLVSFVEAEYGIIVEDEDLVPAHFGTIAAIAGYVGSKRGSGGSAPAD